MCINTQLNGHVDINVYQHTTHWTCRHQCLSTKDKDLVQIQHDECTDFQTKNNYICHDACAYVLPVMTSPGEVLSSENLFPLLSPFTSWGPNKSEIISYRPYFSALPLSS